MVTIVTNRIESRRRCVTELVLSRLKNDIKFENKHRAFYLTTSLPTSRLYFVESSFKECLLLGFFRKSLMLYCEFYISHNKEWNRPSTSRVPYRYLLNVKKYVRCMEALN